jgi:hypothetical protein
MTPWKARELRDLPTFPTAAAEKKNDNFKQKLFNFNFDECVTYMPRYLLLPTSPVAQGLKKDGLLESV